MIVFLLLVIIAIMLFGSGAVLGLIRGTAAFVGGILLAFFLVAGIASAIGVSIETIVWCVVGGMGLLALIGIINSFGDAKAADAYPIDLPPAVSSDVREAMERNRKLNADFNARVGRSQDPTRP